jgi:hypothetical protein
MSNEKLPSEFRARLRQGKYTRWADDLDYDTLFVVLWMMGEIAYRPTEKMFEPYQLAFWGADKVPCKTSEEGKLRRAGRRMPHPRQAIALETLVEIVDRNQMDIGEAMHRVQRYPELFERIATGEVFDVDEERERIDSERS